MLFEHARIEPGQAILVRGAAGSVGTCATQMAKEAGVSVYGTTRTRNIERVRALGAEPVVESDGVGAQLASRPLDAVIDTIGGDALESTCEALRPNGIIVSVVRAPDEAYVRSRGMRAAYFIVDVTRDRLDKISAIVQRGTLKLPVGEVLDLADAKIAHRMLDGAPHKPGKIVLKVQTDRGGGNRGCGKIRCRPNPAAPMGRGEGPLSAPLRTSRLRAAP
jgi:NADPH:quinone reductase-like Zn-dependent oxidoreductase